MTADRRSPSSFFRRAASPCGNARSHIAPADCGLSLVAVCRLEDRDGTRRTKTRCTSPAELAAPRPACCCALRRRWSQRLAHGDTSRSRTGQTCAGITGCRRNGCVLTSARLASFKSDVATRAAVYHAEFGQPDLLDSVWKWRCSVTASLRLRIILRYPMLVVTPFAEVVLSRCNGQRNQ